MTVLSQETRRLELLIRQFGTDGHLELLAGLANLEDGAVIGIGVVMLIDGTLVRGTLTNSLRFAEAADEKIATGSLSARVTGNTDDQDAVRTSIAGAFRGDGGALRKLAQASQDRYWKARERVEKYFATLPEDARVDLDEIPDDLVKDVADAQARHNILTLEGAQIFQGGLGWIDAGYMRVNTGHVGAWWVADPPPQR